MYLAFYGLEQEPFRLTPDPRFLHLAEPHRNTLRSLLEGVGARRGLQVATGPVGTGKTTLLYCLQHVLAHEASPQRPLRTAFIVNPTLSVEEFYDALVYELEIAPSQEGKSARLRALHELLLKSYKTNGNVVVIVDEAHLIPPDLLEEIRLLLNLDNYPNSVLQIILCGQPELLPLLEKPGLSAMRQRIAVFSQLRVLVLGETRAYVAERLHVAGLRGESPFSASAVEEIHRISGGVPRLINLLSDRCLTVGCRQEIKKLGSDCVLEAAEELNVALPVSEAEPGSPLNFSAASSM
jgi:general secretion pathway protein A